MIASGMLVALTLPLVGLNYQPESAARKLAAEIVEKGYAKVGIMPRFKSRVPGGEDTLGGSIGPQADKFAEDLQDDLANLADNRFKVIDGGRIKKAFGSLTIEDLNNQSLLAKVAKDVGGLDALIVGSVLDERDPSGKTNLASLDTRCRLIDVRDGSVAGTAKESVKVTLSEAAYMGESWELRRWTSDGLTNVGLDLPAGEAPEIAFGTGPVYETDQYAMIRRPTAHPLLDPTFPFPTEIIVDGEARKPVQVGDQLYVALDPGDIYQIAMKNDAPRNVYTAVFVDGINVLGKERESPSSCRHWDFAAGNKARFKGWVSGDGGKFIEEEFMITEADATVGAGQGFSEKLGVITVVFYTVGMKDVPAAPKSKAMIVGGTFGTGTSKKTRELNLDMKARELPGPILATVTLHYATSAQIKKLEAPQIPADR